MAWGGGTFTVQNKTLPGAYVNYVNAQRASAALSDRGYAAMPLVLDWGEEGNVFTVTNDDFIRNCQKYFGYDYTHEKMKGLRDVFKNVQTLYVYKLNTGAKASNTFGTAKYAGVRGNDIKIIITANADNESAYDVAAYLDTTMVDKQTVTSAAELVDNDYVDFKKDAGLSLTAATPMTGGDNGTEVTGQAWQNALNALEKYNFNTFGCASTTDTVKDLCIEWTKRMRDEVGVKFQCVVYKKEDADNKAIISVDNKIVGEAEETGSLVYWVTGAEAGCQLGKDLTNKVYDGSFEVDTNYTQAQLVAALKAGKFVFHQAGEDVRVLEDINTLVTTNDVEGDDFKSNQTVRVIDQIGNDVAVEFNTKFLGIIPNNNSGRVSFRTSLVKYCQELERLQAIENFDSANITVSQGDTKKAVVVVLVVTVVNCMKQLYMTVNIQ